MCGFRVYPMTTPFNFHDRPAIATPRRDSFAGRGSTRRAWIGRTRDDKKSDGCAMLAGLEKAGIHALCADISRWPPA
jgi:hypothetical protein